MPNNELQPLFQIEPPEGAEKVKYSIIGGILYDNQTKAVGIGTDQSDKVKLAFRTMTPQDVERIHMQPELFAHLPDDTDLTIGVADIGSVEVVFQPSILQREPSFYARVNYLNADNDQNETYALNREHLLKFMSGQEGGVMVFGGQGIPEENAVLIEQSFNGKKHGRVIFIRPEDKKKGLTSVAGIGEFFENLNKNLTAGLNLPEDIRQILFRLDKLNRRNGGSESLARVEMLKARVIAESLLQTGNDRGFTSRIKADLKVRKVVLFERDRQKDQETVNTRLLQTTETAVKAITINYAQAAEKLEVPGEPKLLIVERKLDLVTEAAQQLYDRYHGELREGFGSDIEPTRPMMHQYLIKTIELIRQARSSNDFKDIGLLLDELSTTQYGNQGKIKTSFWTERGMLNPRSYLRGSIPALLFDDSGIPYTQEVKEILEVLKKHTASKKAAAFKKELKKT